MVGIGAAPVGHPIAVYQAQAVAFEQQEARLAGVAGVVDHGEVLVPIILQLFEDAAGDGGGEQVLQIVGGCAAAAEGEQAGCQKVAHGRFH
ncbi:hypothetical protein OH686_00165 [Pseudomonas sp. SO81]|nr:hypothetical protein OH686_00165 [Pseudomonas sp. SO81]